MMITYLQERSVRPNTTANKLHALRYLLIQVLLQVLLRPGEFSEAASELILCCKKAFSSSDLLESSGEDELDDNETPELMDVLVDTLLSLLPQSSAPMRSAIEQVSVKLGSQASYSHLLIIYYSVLFYIIHSLFPAVYLCLNHFMKQYRFMQS